MLQLHGGELMPYLDQKTPVTHIVASNLTAKKRIEFERFKVVKPEWVVKSVEEGRRLDWRDFRTGDRWPEQRTQPCPCTGTLVQVQVQTEAAWAMGKGQSPEDTGRLGREGAINFTASAEPAAINSSLVPHREDLHASSHHGDTLLENQPPAALATARLQADEDISNNDATVESHIGDEPQRSKKKLETPVGTKSDGHRSVGSTISTALISGTKDIDQIPEAHVPRREDIPFARH
ncbi:hypothetical protein L7F22_010070 [Adiantum nelumboides]|nr:hypothetical protein [Adiantum nelumboides]